MSIEKVAPGSIAIGAGAPGRVDDILEDHGREHPVDLRGRSRTCQKLLHLSEYSVAGVEKREMVGPRNLNQSCAGDASGQLAAAFDAHQRVIRQVDNQGRNPYGTKNSGNVDFAIHPHQRDGGGWACAKPFEFAPPPPQRGVARFRRGEGRQTLAGAPALVDVLDQRVKPFVSRMPVEEARKRAIEDERLAPFGMTGGKKRGKRAALRKSKQRSALDADRVHHSADIVHALVHGRQVRDAVREAGATLVEKDDAAKAAELVQPARQTRFVPIIFEMRDEARRHYQVGSLAEYLIGDVDLAAFGVARGVLHFAVLPDAVLSSIFDT